MLYSSGTTGRPKGIKRASDHHPIELPNPFLKILCADMCGMNSDSIYLSPAPLYHAAPLRFNMMAITLGGTSIIMEHFDAEEFLKLVEKHKVTQSQLVPTMFVRMLKLPEEVRKRYDVSSLKGAIHAAAPCPIDVKAKMIEWWGPILIEYYAGSEGNGVTVSTSQQWLTHRGTVGRAVVGKVKILDENDQEAPTGQIGTVYFADAPVFAYHNDPEKTKRAYNARGWSTLGDVGYLDEEGFLYLTDRKSYMIISGGVNIYPQETEDVLITHPGVADVAVFGVPNEEMGEEVKAVVQPHDMKKAGKELEAELILFCRKHLSPIKCPKSIDFEAELPRTPTGKLVKRHLRDKYWPKKEMAEEEKGHRHMLLEMYEKRFGKNLPPIRRENVKGFLRRRPLWLTKNLSLDTIRKEAETMEFEAERFYVKAAEQTQDVGVRRLLGDLAEAEKGHESLAARLTDKILKPDVRAEEDKTRRRVFVLQYVQPGLAGLMDGSVSTLAPLFAAAFATHQNWQTFLVGFAASTHRT